MFEKEEEEEEEKKKKKKKKQCIGLASLPDAASQVQSSSEPSG